MPGLGRGRVGVGAGGGAKGDAEQLADHAGVPCGLGLVTMRSLRSRWLEEGYSREIQGALTGVVAALWWVRNRWGLAVCGQVFAVG
ncbi:hypothetical protein GCM10010510_71900 [Streptomyces anandii JCM 4720]|nr:hypothetical protein GCM10010510_71900 [Streptomyces anandii JCM 4720]